MSSEFYGRRQMLSTAARSVAAIALIASTTVVKTTTTAEANCGHGVGSGGPGVGNGNGGTCAGGGNCFLKGTLIDTPDGQKKIEDLLIGDLVTTIGGAARPVQFISAYSYKKADPSRDWVEDVKPVVVRKSAISDNVPSRDLSMTRAHALYLDGMLVPVCNLINGSTIVVDDAEDLSELEYFHVKFESHDVIYAEGAACESMLTVSESAKNFADYYRAHGFPESDPKPFAPIHSFWSRRSQLASRVRSAVSPIKESRQPLDVVRDRLDARAASLVGSISAG
jgi:Hint domain